MSKTLKLTNGELLINYYHSNIEICCDGEWARHSFDGDIDYSTEENLNDFIDNELSQIIELTAKDVEKIKEELKNAFYMNSADVHEGK